MAVKDGSHNAMEKPKYAAADVLAGKDKPKGKSKPKMREMSIRKGHAGGYIAKNHLEHDDGRQESHEFPLVDMKQLQAHVQEHMGADDATQQPEVNAESAE